MPVYNESRYIADLIDRVRAAPLPSGLAREIIVVNDGSSDGTREQFAPHVGSPDVRVLDSIRNQGKGIAIRRGLAAARGSLVLLQDADPEYDPADYPRASRAAPRRCHRRLRVSLSRSQRGQRRANRIPNYLRVAVNLV